MTGASTLPPTRNATGYQECHSEKQSDEESRPAAAYCTSKSLSLYRGDPLFRLLLDRWQLRPLHLGLLTIGVGFGVLSVWYITLISLYPDMRQLRGLFEFYSATLGDAVLLPVLNCLAVWYCHYVAAGLSRQIKHTFADQPQARQDFLDLCDRAYNCPLVTIGLVALVVLSTFLWHLSEVHGPDRNWALPVQGQINPAGIYHQVFWGLEAYISLFLAYRHVATVWLILRLGQFTPDRAALARFSQEVCALFSTILLGWGSFGSLFLVDFFYNAASISFEGLFSQSVALFVVVYYYAILFALGVVPVLVLLGKLGQRLTVRKLPVLIALSCAVVFVGPVVRIALA